MMCSHLVAQIKAQVGALPHTSCWLPFGTPYVSTSAASGLLLSRI